MKTVADYMTKDVISISGSSSVLEAIKSMRKHGVSSLLIKRGDTNVGIFTERDLLNRVNFNVSGGLDSIKVKDVMTKALKTTDSNESYVDVIELMHRYKVRHMPVVKGRRIIGIVSLRDLLNHYHETLESLLEETVAALSSAVEKRDPYTAGHQLRVTQLACAIAKEMKLPENQISGLRMAAVIHDVGKMYVPAQILDKPGSLSEAELTLIRIHPRVGYDILKHIDFPWPVAEIVLQHHERLNGSGYPQGLVGGHILLEAKVISIADIVEAMASHRPYRPALGVDKALKEIEQHKGVLYEPAVVNACIKLFKKKKFQFTQDMTAPMAEKSGLFP